MADKLTEALSLFVELCPHVVSTYDSVTKVRIELKNGFALEIYLRETIAQYSYTLLRADQRLVGWDNAPHHPDLPNAPHHMHNEDGTIESSPLTGDQTQDIRIVAEWVNSFFAS